MNNKYINKLWAKTLKDKGAWYYSKCTATKRWANENDPEKDKTVDAVIIEYMLSSYIAYFDKKSFKVEPITLWDWNKRKNKSDIDRIINKRSDTKWLEQIIKPIHKKEQEKFKEHNSNV